MSRHKQSGPCERPDWPGCHGSIPKPAEHRRTSTESSRPNTTLQAIFHKAKRQCFDAAAEVPVCVCADTNPPRHLAEWHKHAALSQNLGAKKSKTISFSDFVCADQECTVAQFQLSKGTCRRHLATRKTHHVGPRRARDRCGVLHNLPSEQQTRNSSSAVQDPFCGDSPCLHVSFALRCDPASPAVIEGFFASCMVNRSVLANVCRGTSAETPESVHHHEVTRMVHHFSFDKIHYRSR